MAELKAEPLLKPRRPVPDGIDPRDGEQITLIPVAEVEPNKNPQTETLTAVLPLEVAFSVYGEVRTNERARHGKGVTYTPAKTTSARREIVEAFRATQIGAGLHEGPVRLSVTVQHATQPDKLWPGRFCRRKPDLDNVVKLVSDALNKVAYLDDAQIVEVSARKSYAETSAIHVVLTFEAEQSKPPHGLVPDTRLEGRWHVWRHGVRIGEVTQIGKAKFAARTSSLIRRLRCPDTKDGYWKSKGAARAAIEAHEAHARGRLS